MLHLKRTNPEISKYIREQTNKSIEKYLINYPSSFGLRVSDLVKPTDIDSRIPNCCLILPFVSLISFFAGYSFHNLIQK